MYFDKLVLFSVLPILLFVIAFAFWITVASIKKNMNLMKSEFVATITIVFFLIHPSIVKTFFQVFSCRDVHGEYWLTENLEVTCWEGDHLTYALAVALPSCIIWGIGTPAF